MTGFVRLHALLVDDDPLAQVCRDLPESACHEQPHNYGVHIVSLSLTKVGEGLADAKLVLAWLLDAIGTPTWALGLLVPVRESLAMLPQLVISARIRRLPIRKSVYVLGCVIQGAAIIGFGMMGWFAQLFSGALAGIVAVALIAIFALGRSLCSISHKDVLGKTVDKGRRGSVGGTAGTIAAVATLLLAVAYSAGWIPLTVPVVSGMVALGGACWLLAAFVFGLVREEPGATAGGIDGLVAVIAQLGLLRSDAQLRRLIVTRTLLLSSALAPPFYIALSGDSAASGLGTLGSFMIAAAAASLSSTYVWGRFSDRSSRLVLMLAATLAALANAAAAFFALAMPTLLEEASLLPALLFVLMIAHQGVRLGRSVHVVDMTDHDNRATYTALSNSVVGLVLLAGGVFGVIAQWLGIGAVLAIFTSMAALAIIAAAGLDDVQTA
ncbi:MAG: MFS transporter permease [Proteobacteria bacterium]|nr:MAG: MFS transporter permease [Pseudomonadota bacterium]QKK12140.1 MAG: MFS transporter permease [Pseudomonadota bacterium]